MTVADAVAVAVAAVRRVTALTPRVGLILGSGLGGFAERIDSAASVPYADVPGMGRSTAPGHVGRFVLGDLGGVAVVAMQGRLHVYEGYSAAEVAFPVRVLAGLGCTYLIVTNAAGGLRPGQRVGDLLLIEDHLFLPGMIGHSPLRGVGVTEGVGLPFVDLNRAYDPDLRTLARRLAAERNVRLHRGVYAMVAGPHFESAAEIRALQALGADVVGMSTCPEVVVARQCGLRVLALSCITNLASGGEETTVDHEEVLVAGRQAGPHFEALVRAVLAEITVEPNITLDVEQRP